MKIVSTICVLMLVMSVTACGHTIGELKTDSDVIVDTGMGVANQTVNTVGTIVKKLLSVGFAVYDLGKKMVDDVKDNTITVKNVVTGASETSPSQ